VRAKPAVHFGGKFRIIDFALSNCINSGMRSIGVITQYKSHSLLRHLQRGWSFLRKELNEFVELLPAQQRVDEEHWYQGTADAVYQNLDIIRDESRPPEYILILAGDHVYKMDYWVMLRDHVQSGRKVTVGCIEVPRRDAHAFGVMAIDDARHITQFVEKPADPPAMPGNPRCRWPAWASTSSTRPTFTSCSRKTPATRFQPRLRQGPDPPRGGRGPGPGPPLQPVGDHHAALLGPYWRDVGTIDAYWAANLDLASTTPALNMYDKDWPIWTYQEQLAPPSSCTTRRPPRHGGGFAGVGRLHRVGLRDPQLGALLEHPGTLLLRDQRAVVLPDVDQPPLPAAQGGHRPRLQAARRPGDRRRPRARRAPLPPHRRRRGAGHPADARRPQG
jgi:glucose-1-phosphate adenylyltransferase